MPIVSFSDLPDSARVWVFASDKPLAGATADTLLASVDRFLSEWRAHGVPLHCAREWRDDRFLAVGVDVNEENASGCSIDGLFRTLQQLEKEIGSRLVGGGRVFYRTASGIEATPRNEFVERVKRGDIARETLVFDTSLTSAADWRSKFELPADAGWTAGFFATSHS
ncbi:MAG TPA: hypothetical protein VIP11_09480 [Gemmatimonadaceae bacterium]